MATPAHWIGHLRRIAQDHAGWPARGRSKSLRASGILIGPHAAMFLVFGLAFVSTHLLSATAEPAAKAIELLESLK